MTDSKESRQQPKDEAILRSIRASRPKDPSNFIRPDEAAIMAYVLDSATPLQSQLVQDALCKSESFRREILHMVQDLNSLEQPENIDISPLENQGRQRALFSVLATAALLAFVFVGTQLFKEISDAPTPLQQWSLDLPSVEPGLLIANATRHINSSTPALAFATADSAALEQMRSLLHFSNGRIEPSPNLAPRPGAPQGRALDIRFLNADGSLKNQVQIWVPHQSKNLEAWLLLLPTRNIYRIKLADSVLDVAWPEETDQASCLTVTHEGPKGFESLTGIIIHRQP